MNQYLMTFKSATPLMVGERRAVQNRKSLDYIPGGTLLGGLAYAYLRKKRLSVGEKDEMFKQFFLNEGVRFGNLYPATFKESQDISNEYPVKPLPKTARTCKRWPGFIYQSEEDEQEKHGVADHLIFWALFAKTKERHLVPLTEHQSCHCGQQLDHFPGFYRMDSPEICGKPDMSTRLVTGTGIDRLTGTVQQEILFSREVIARVTSEGEEQFFQGLLCLDETIEKDVLAFLRDKSLHLRVGQAKTRGFGSLQLTECFEEADETFEEFCDRLTTFDETFKEQAKKYELKEAYDIDVTQFFYFAITCCADMIIREPDLRYKTRLTKDHMASLLQMSSNTLHLVYHNADIRRIRGWNTLWRLPKTMELAIEKGSVFLFEYTQTPDPDDEFFQKLQQLEQQGIGVRKPEGFGWISISDPFHQEVEQRWEP